jgi:diguanylate cyclase (GGDEF)-like protein
MTQIKKTLTHRLADIIDTDHLEEVRNIISTLTEVNSFKHTIENSLCKDTLYATIIQKLQDDFKINDFAISVCTHENEEIIFRQGDTKDFPFFYSSQVAKKTTLYIYYAIEKINDYQIIILNTYLKELIPLLYIQYILNELQMSATLDPLTQLHTRISFDQEMKTLIPLAIREKMKLGLMLINIDRFQAVNDEHGNQFGDQFLKLYAQTIKKSVRTSDIVVRFNGGEFLVLLINIDIPQRVLDIADKIRENLAQTSLRTKNGDDFKKTVCIGTSVFPDDANEIHDIIRNAEIALNEAQHLGRNNVQAFQEKQISTIELF